MRQSTHERCIEAQSLCAQHTSRNTAAPRSRFMRRKSKSSSLIRGLLFESKNQTDSLNSRPLFTFYSILLVCGSGKSIFTMDAWPQQSLAIAAQVFAILEKHDFQKFSSWRTSNYDIVCKTIFQLFGFWIKRIFDYFLTFPLQVAKGKLDKSDFLIFPRNFIITRSIFKRSCFSPFEILKHDVPPYYE